ncbi:uncharacterized protein A4U43_UnF3270 [Asparagus officinalis]|uniref:Uncharacterized protein n=1 Tax=Asparagus officinalis TaxID=4686 RepID=A0A1R3L752_ASPOF|nr:uncharacterized protein A4U43_UnF3270 [Asparagus officinalis]
MLVHAELRPLCNEKTYPDMSPYGVHVNLVLRELRFGLSTGHRLNPDVFGQAICYFSHDDCVSDNICSVRYEPYPF